MFGNKDADQTHFFRRIQVLLLEKPTAREMVRQKMEDGEKTHANTSGTLIEPVRLFPMVSIPSVCWLMNNSAARNTIQKFEEGCEQTFTPFAPGRLLPIWFS